MAWAAVPRLQRSLQRADPSAPLPAPPSATEALREPGQPLDHGTRRLMESRFQHDFSRVRVHSGRRAATAARELGAAAYTTGCHIFFGEGAFDPGSSRGRGLVAHELAHVVYEGGGTTAAARAVEPVDSIAERSAQALAAHAVRGEPMESFAAAGPARTGRILRATRNFELTFDDGPHHANLGTGENRTERVLDTLKAKGSLKAGFFIQTGVGFRGGSRVGRALVERMHREGHSVGIHTGGAADHEEHPIAERAGRLESELKGARSYVKAVTGEDATLVRPPYGKSDKAVQATYGRVGLTSLLWDIDGDPGGSLGLPELKRRFTEGLTPIVARGWTRTRKPDGVVVLYHDIRKGTADHIGEVIDHIRDTTKTLTGGKDTATFRAP